MEAHENELDGPRATGATEGAGAVDVGHGLGERGGEVGHETVGVDGRPGAVLDLLDRHEPPGLAVDDDLGDAAGRGRDDGELARHRLEVDDAERLVDRRAGEDRAMADSSATTSSRGSMSGIQTTPSRCARSSFMSPSTSARISGVSGAPAQSTSWTSGGSCAHARSR